MKSVQNILIAVDKFKSTFSAKEITSIIYKGLSAINPKLNYYNYPLADGGEGTADILSAYYKAVRINVKVNNPIFRKIKSHYYYNYKKKLAIIDLSDASGLYLLKKDEQNPMLTSTFGTGEMILDAVSKGAKSIVLGLGGSGTNDAAIGTANTLGYKFLSKNNNELKPIGKNLINIDKIDESNLKIDLEKIKFTALYDVANNLFGENGASYTFSQQKGAKPEETKILDEGLKNFNRIICQKFGKDLSLIKGGGSAGGFGAGSVAFLNANLKPGSKTVLDLLNIDKYIKKSNLIITGEGKFDMQSLNGKVTGELIKRAEIYKKPVAIICGISEIDATELNNYINIYPLFNNFVEIETAKQKTNSLIKEKIKKIYTDFLNGFDYSTIFF